MKKKLTTILFVILAVLLAVPSIVLASDVTGANYLTRITVSNAGSGTATNEAFVVSLSTAGMIDAGLLSANATDAALRTSGGDDLPFQFAANATYSFVGWVESVGATGTTDTYLFSDGASGGMYSYFPGEDGLIVADNATIEGSGNVTFEARGWLNTSTGSSKYLLRKGDAFEIYPDNSGNVTARILVSRAASGDWVNPTSASGTSWVDPANAIDGSTVSYAEYDIPPNGTSEYLIMPLNGANITDRIQIYCTREAVGTPVNQMDMWVYHDGAWDNIVNFAAFGVGSYETKTIGSFEAVESIRVRFKSTFGAGNAWIRVHSVQFDEPDRTYDTITATGVTSTNQTVRVSLLSNMLSNGNMEVGDPPTGWSKLGAGVIGRSTTQKYVDTYSCNITTSAASTYARQAIAWTNDFRGREYTFGCWVYSDNTSAARLGFYDGVGESYSSYHTGVAGWEWLSVTREFNIAATQGLVSCRLQTYPNVAYFDGAIVVEGDSITDFNTFRIFLDGVEQDQLYTENAVPDNDNDWEFVTNYAMIWVEYVRLWLSELD